MTNSFTEKFKTEVGEYCERLEAGLLQLGQSPDDQQIIGEIFRILHTMKGSGGMFGFDMLSDVTHDLESLFELFRSGKQSVDSEVISFLLGSVDTIKQLMVEDPTPELEQLAQSLKAETQKQIERFAGGAGEAQNQPKIPAEKSHSENPTYFISFAPNEDILKNGTNPLYLVDELNSLGECNIQVSTDRIPALFEMDATKCYISWYLFISTPESENTLRDVFLFVSDTSDISIEKVSNSNVVWKESTMAAFLNARENGEEWHIEELKDDDLPVSGEDEKADEAPIPKAILKVQPNLGGPAVFERQTVDSIRVDSDKIDRYMNLVSEFITAQSRLEQMALALKNPDLEQIAENWGKLNRQLRDNAFEMSLIPLQSLEVRFKRLVFDLSKSLGKEITLITEGLETELDKTIIENLAEPLLHLIRNSIDHGIEPKEQRLLAGKKASGAIYIRAFSVGGYVQIEIEDDGKGLDLKGIKEKALSKGIISGADQLADQEIVQLIFEPGFSTAEVVTDISGRGVGLDVVRKSIQNMRGSVMVASEPGKYTRFIIRLPLSLSIIDGLLIRVGSSYYVIPSSVVIKLFAVKAEQQKKQFRHVIEIEGMQIPYLNLTHEFEPDLVLPDEQQMVTVSYENYQVGLIIDEVIRDYQAVVKPLGWLLKSHEVFSGVNILGSGDLALVIDTNKLIQKYL